MVWWSVLRKLTQNDKVEWDKCLPFVLWAYRGTVHATTGFSPYKLLFGREMRMPLDEQVRFWKGKEVQNEMDITEHIEVMRANMEVVRDFAQQNEEREKRAQKHYHDRKVVERKFEVGDFVLVFRPTQKNKLLNEWQGPFIVTKQITEVTYQVDTGASGKCHKMFHVDAMKSWTSTAPAVFLTEDQEMDDLFESNEEIKSNALSLMQHTQLTQLKEKYKDIIQDVPGRTRLVHHDILTGNSPPIRLPPYRLAHTAQEVLREEIKSLLEQNIIEPSKSPWSVPIVLVPKKDGTTRMCVDYRKLNAVTTGDPYPLPHIEDLINDIGSAKYITTLDLTKGYYQVPMGEDSREKTAFVTPYGKYQFVTMPFGLVSAPSTFQRLMDHVLQGLHSFSTAYLDDILICSNTWEEHVQHLTEVFGRLREAGLHIKDKKCNFAVNSCNYLGHVVGGGEVRPMDCKVKAVKEYERPKTKKQVRAFLGLCGYYRRFISSFSTVAHSLTELTRKNKENVVKWNEACEHSFNLLKEALTSKPVLTTPDWTRKFILQTDASATVLGYVLSQKDQNEEEHPIAYGSKKLLPREQKYSAIEREGLAIVQGIKHFRTYLQGTTFQIETDHDLLTHLGSMKDSHDRLARWALALQPYQFTIVHSAGTANANADGLSRDQGSRSKERGVSEKPLTGEFLMDSVKNNESKETAVE